MKLLSVIVPCFNEEESLPLFYEKMNKVSKTLVSMELEILFIDDGSKDNTLDVIKSFVEKDSRVKFVSFSRNFGKEAAIYAGFKKCIGDYVVLMDADLQDPPSLLPKMLDSIINEGFDSVATRRVSRKGEPIFPMSLS